jgi:hypothetical protein
MTEPYLDADRLIGAIAPRLKRLQVAFIIDEDLKKLGLPILISDFGSENGIAVAPILDPAPMQTEYYINYKHVKIPISRLNIDYLDICSDDDITDMLIDWGYFGPQNRRPGFIDDNSSKSSKADHS